MMLNHAFDKFILEKRISGLKEVSISDYRNTLTRFLRSFGNTEISQLAYDDVGSYILGLYKSGLSRATVSTYVRNARIFLCWVSAEYGLSFDATKVKIPKSPKKVVHIYTDDEIRDIFKSIESAIPWITARNRAVVSLMLDSGIRQCEVCDLLRTDIDRKRNIMKVSGKGSKDRMVPIGRVSLYLIDKYLLQCPYESSYVFMGRTGKPMSRNAVKLFTYRLQKELPYSFSSHRLRHNFATNYCIDHVRKNGQSDVYDLSILMGHESVETTKKYEHFAHEIIAAENSISHLDGVWEIEKMTEF